MKTISGALQQARSLLSADGARLDADVLLMHTLKCDRSFLYSHGSDSLSSSEASGFECNVQRRVAGEPVAYITGTREFWSLPLSVNAHTLIPRPDTETLVSHALELCGKENARVLDLGTGTGAIALALASENPSWTIDAVDVVQEAVCLAQKNSTDLNLHNVRIYVSNWFADVPPEQFDLIIANPPYVADGDPHLQLGDVAFEPLSALVAGNNGLADLQFIIEQAFSFLAEGAWLVLEHGFEQAQPVRDFMLENHYTDVHTVNDFSHLPRVTAGKKYGERRR